MEAEYAAEYARLYREHWWWRVREQILVGKIRETLKGRASDTRILDIGCGAGVLFDVLESFGHVEGIEADRVAVEQSGRWRARIHHGELDDTFNSVQTFDLILLLDVLEHVQHPDQLLRRASRLLSPGGHVLATVPAFDWLWTSHDEMNHHVKRYTAPELRALMTSAGFTVTETHYLFQSLVIPKLLIRAKDALMTSGSGIPRIPSPLLNRALQIWYRSEHVVAGRLPFGTSVLAVARRA